MLRPVAIIRTLILLFACFTASQAWAFDITFNVSGSAPYFAGESATINYTVTAVTLNSGNTLTVQLSDALGSFGTPVNIGSIATQAATGSIQITFPCSATGTAYKLRIVSSNNPFTGTAGAPFTINQIQTPASITITADPVTSVGGGSVVYFSSSITNGGTTPSYQWMKNGVNVPTAPLDGINYVPSNGKNETYVLQNAADGDQVSVVMSPVCGLTPATSNTISVTANPDMTQTNHSWGERARQPAGTPLGFINRSNASGFTIGNPTNLIYVGCGNTGTTLYKDLWAYDPQLDTWSQKADLPGVERYNAVGFNVGLKAFIGMGMTANGAVKDFYEYSASANTWQARAPLPGPAREQAFGFGISGKGYVGGGVSGGVDLKDFYEFDTSPNTWSTVGAKPDFAGGKRMGAAAFVIGSKGYVLGGFSTSTGLYYNDLYEYDPVTSGGTWTAKTSMPGAGRTRASAFTLAGQGYAGGGYTASGYDGKFFMYDQLSNGWSQKAFYPGPTTRSFGVGLTLGNRAFVYKDGTMFEYNLFTLTSFPSKLCSTETIPVNYDASGFVFNGANVMTAQLSSTPGFNVVTNLKTEPTSASSGTINVPIPPTVNSGTYYFRMTSSNPPLATLLETITITRVETNHVVTPEGGNSVCVGVPVTFDSNITGTGFTWYKNDVAVGYDSPTYLASGLVDQDQIKAVKRYTTGCQNPVDVVSNPIVKMTIRTPAKPTVTISGPNTLQSSNATAFQWYQDDVAIPNAKNQSYQMTGDGVYKVKITDNTGCSVFSDDQVNVYTGLENDSYNLDVTAYPSPFIESTYLSLADHIVAQGCDFTLMNELGQTVVNKQRAEKVNKLDLTGRAPGLYILRISFGHTTVVRKLVKTN